MNDGRMSNKNLAQDESGAVAIDSKSPPCRRTFQQTRSQLHYDRSACFNTLPNRGSQIEQHLSGEDGIQLVGLLACPALPRLDRGNMDICAASQRAADQRDQGPDVLRRPQQLQGPCGGGVTPSEANSFWSATSDMPILVPSSRIGADQANAMTSSGNAEKPRQP